LVGFDDIEDGRYATPTLTTVKPDKEQVGRVAVELLADRLGGDRDTPPRELFAGHKLSARESTLGPAAPG
ncbi:MAG: LacI family transcriptional regulator, partial [Micromonosporaceae bacterium]|nr:LacI family transcriptional regulator [Micromonosporaceae bacterium]